MRKVSNLHYTITLHTNNLVFSHHTTHYTTTQQETPRPNKLHKIQHHKLNTRDMNNTNYITYINTNLLNNQNYKRHTNNNNIFIIFIFYLINLHNSETTLKENLHSYLIKIDEYKHPSSLCPFAKQNYAYSTAPK